MEQEYWLPGTVIRFFFPSKFLCQKLLHKIIFAQHARSKYLLEKFVLYNYICENNFRAFSAHENIYTTKKITVYLQ